MLRRYLRKSAASPDDIERMPFADLIRAENSQGLVRGDWPVWRRFREMRARTSQTCDAKAASEVVAAIPAFLEEVEHFYSELQRRPRMTGPSIDLAADHRRIVLEILRAHLPQDVKTWVFGSRATGRARCYSDLDLAIDAGRRLTMDEVAALAEAFSDSDLPYKVDLVDWPAADNRWRETIATERVPLVEAMPR
jgi:predicted nucleotidyltransferase